MRGRSLALVLAPLMALLLAPAARADVFYRATGTLVLPPALSGKTISGVAVDGAGNVYAGVRRDSTGNSVVVFGADGKHVRTFDIGGTSAGVGRGGGFTGDELDLAVGPDGLLYIGQPVPGLGTAQDRYVSVYTTSGDPVRELKLSDETLLIGDLEVDATGNLFVLARHDGFGATRGRPDEILKVDQAGAVTARFALTTQESAPLEGDLGGLAVAADGSIWVTTPRAGGRLVHFGANGIRLASPTLDAIAPVKNKRVKDVEFAGGLLYVAAAAPNGVIVMTPDGRRLSGAPGEARQLAVAGDAVYATKLDAGPARTARDARDDAIAQYLATQAQPPSQGSGVQEVGSCDKVVTHFAADNQLHLNIPSEVNCDVVYSNYGTPRCSGGPAVRPINVYLGGRSFSSLVFRPLTPPMTARFELNRRDMGDGGSVVVEWSCPGTRDSVFELKGSIELIDPSGTVVDAASGRPVEFATVRLQFTPARGGAFGTPSLSLMRPQVNPQTTGAGGAFGWDVAPGFWRLRVSAFGYRLFTSATFQIPPEVTGLKLRLRRSAAFRRLIDPAGSVGTVKVGAMLRRRVAGLRISARRGRVREIAVRTRAFQTAAGIRLRSTEIDLRRAYPAARRSGRVLRFRRALFTVRGGRVVAIRLRA